MMTRAWLLVPVAALALAATACGGGTSSSGGNTGANTSTPSSQGRTVAVRDAAPGKILVSNGMTLYLFEKDTGSESTCSGECATDWPPLTTSGSPHAGEGVDASKLGTTKRDDGSTQVTYAGHPLYFFADDSAPGDTNGQGLDAYGAEWYVLSPAGTKIESGEEGEETGEGY